MSYVRIGDYLISTEAVRVIRFNEYNLGANARIDRGTMIVRWYDSDEPEPFKDVTREQFEGFAGRVTRDEVRQAGEGSERPKAQ